MLTQNDRELIAASLDGPLPAAAQTRLRKLLDHSKSARHLLRKLRQDRDALRQLPQVKAPETVLPLVMARIAETSPFATIPSSTVRVPIRNSRWVPIAVAASIVMMISLGTYQATKSNSTHDPRQEQAQALPKFVVNSDGDGRVVRTRIAEELDPPVFVEPMQVVQGTEQAPLPRSVKEAPLPPVYASPLVVPPKLDSVLVKLPLMLRVSELSRDDATLRLTKELQQQAFTRIDLFSAGDAVKGVEAFQAAAKAAGIAMTPDAIAAERLKRKLPGAWMIYTDSMTAAEVTALLVRLVPSADSSPSQKVFDSLHVIAANATDRKDSKDLLGIELASKKESPMKSVTAGTIEHVTNSLSKSKPEKTGVLVTFLPPNMRTSTAASNEIKAWRDTRSEPKPGTVAVMVVIR